MIQPVYEDCVWPFFIIITEEPPIFLNHSTLNVVIPNEILCRTLTLSPRLSISNTISLVSPRSPQSKATPLIAHPLPLVFLAYLFLGRDLYFALRLAFYFLISPVSPLLSSKYFPTTLTDDDSGKSCVGARHYRQTGSHSSSTSPGLGTLGRAAFSTTPCRIILQHEYSRNYSII